MVKLDRFVGSCSTLNDSTFSKQNRRFKSKHAYRITGSNESKILTKDISCKCKCRFPEKNRIQVNGGTMLM